MSRMPAGGQRRLQKWRGDLIGERVAREVAELLRACGRVRNSNARREAEGLLRGVLSPQADREIAAAAFLRSAQVRRLRRCNLTSSR